MYSGRMSANGYLHQIKKNGVRACKKNPPLPYKIFTVPKQIVYQVIQKYFFLNDVHNIILHCKTIQYIVLINS